MQLPVAYYVCTAIINVCIGKDFYQNFDGDVAVDFS